MPCKHSWPWPKIDVDIVGCWVEPRGGFYPLLSSPSLIRRGVTLVSRFSIRKIPSRGPGMKWFNRGVEDRIALFLFLLYTVENFLFFFFYFHPSYPALDPTLFLFFFLCKKPRSLASPLPGVQWFRGKVSFSKKPMTGYVTMLVLSGTLSKPVVRVVKSFTFRFNDVWMETEIRLKNIVDRFFL